MYSFPVRSPEQRAAHDIACTQSSRALAAVQTEYVRFREFDARGLDDPLSGLELLELDTISAVLAGALERAADEWDRAGTDPARAAAYRQLAGGYQAMASLAEALTDIAAGEVEGA